MMKSKEFNDAHDEEITVQTGHGFLLKFPLYPKGELQHENNIHLLHFINEYINSICRNPP